MKVASQVRSLALILVPAVVAFSVVMSGSLAQAEIIVYSGTNFRVEVSSPVNVGITPLKAVTLTAIGLNGYKPNAFDSTASSGTGITTTSNLLHQIYQLNEDDEYQRTPTLLLDPNYDPIPLDLDTHFLISNNYIVPPGTTAPNENRPTVGSTENQPGGGYGNKLYGTFTITGTPSESWDFAYIVVQNGTQVNLNFTIAGLKGESDVTNEIVTGSFSVVPEPGTFVMLCTGGIGLLVYVWRRRRL